MGGVLQLARVPERERSRRVGGTDTHALPEGGQLARARDTCTCAASAGVSKAGNRHVRALAIEIAWGWLRYQPESELSQWYQRRFGGGRRRVRGDGVGAVARRVLG